MFQEVQESLRGDHCLVTEVVAVMIEGRTDASLESLCVHLHLGILGTPNDLDLGGL